MTSDAKIGLILGLVFIFIIAFIINGLPGLNQQESSNELTAKMLQSTNNSLGIAANQRKTNRQVINPIPIKAQAPVEVQSKPVDQTNIRYTAELPQTVVKTLSADKKIPAKSSREYVVKQDDSLWRIAAEQLGNGTRYNEIAKLNSAVLDSEDHLTVGMRLKLPLQ